jgi:hypothetical protein
VTPKAATAQPEIRRTNTQNTTTMNTPENAEHRTPEKPVQTSPADAAAPPPQNAPAAPLAGLEPAAQENAKTSPPAEPAPGPNSASPGQNSRAASPESPPAAPAGDNPAEERNKLVVSPSLGQLVELLSEAEQAEYCACEEVVANGWQTFVQVGLALARIRDGRLYRMEDESFEQYCRLKWEYGRNYVDRLISAAQVFTNLVTNSHQKPGHETQLRPLVGLTPDQAQQAWEHAVEKAAGRRITARIVKAAVQELGLGPGAKQAAPEPRQTRAEKRRLIDEAIGQLLVLLSQTASHHNCRQALS